MTGAPTLAGRTVAVTAARRHDELAAALERRGARVMHGPAIRIVPLADDAELREATRRCVSVPLDHVVVTTAVGFSGWLDAAQTWGSAQPLTAALAAAAILTRGPKARGAVRAAGLREVWSPHSESVREVVDHLLAAGDLSGKRIAMQLHGESQPELVAELRAAGADVIEVPVYRWLPPVDPLPLHRVIEATAAGTLDCVTFTSAPAAVNLLRTADELGCDVVAACNGRVLCAAVGSVTAAPLLRAGVPVVQPERARLGALVRTVETELSAPAAR